MNYRSSLNLTLVWLGCAGNLLAPAGASGGEFPRRPQWGSSSGGLARGADVEMTDEGCLRGVLVRTDGQPLAGAPIAVHGAGRLQAKVTTGPQGQFCVAGLRGGVYHVQTAAAGQTLRLWTPGTAPPSAESTLRLVARNPVVRGQGDRRIGLSSDAILLGTVVAAGVTVPILISNRRSDSPPGS